MRRKGNETKEIKQCTHLEMASDIDLLEEKKIIDELIDIFNKLNEAAGSNGSFHTGL